MDIPNSVTAIEWAAFSSCSSLTSVTIPNSVTYIGSHAFRDCSSLTSVDIPNSITTILEYTFASCSSLTSVTIPNSVTSIGGAAFWNCSSLTSISIPTSVTNIGSGTFGSCSKLKEVFCYAEKVPSTDKNAFNESYPQNATLYVPVKSMESYKYTEPWNKFGTVKAVEGDVKKCDTPSISYANKELTFSSNTEGVEYHYTITDSDIKSDVANKITLSATYFISVYATKEGSYDSDIATATLVWTEAIFTETTSDTPTSAKAVTESIPVLISANNGNITVKSEANGQSVAVYSVEGQLLGNATVNNGLATVSTTLDKGSVAIVKVGNKSVKVVMQ